MSEIVKEGETNCVVTGSMGHSRGHIYLNFAR